ncbi:MAG TPA: flavoprotein [Rhizomicrobium sp.]|nr:flavoprotein [Rhizomicrobium sp.]
MNVLCREMLLGVSGSISALSLPGYIDFLRRGLVGRIRVIMTASATEIIPAATIRGHTGEAVFVDSFAGEDGLFVPHIQLTREADIFVVMPATANVIAKAANGIADDLLSTAILASPAPVVFVPCMNEQMWFSPATQANVDLARQRGYFVLEPTLGTEIADLQPTFGVMPPMHAILEALAGILKTRRRAEQP